MANTFFGLTIASSGLGASNIAINTTAHNISNINTEGYSKQVARQEATSAIRVYSSYGTVGTGVAVTTIDQLRSSYYDTKYWQANTNYGRYSTLENYMTLLEDYLDEFNLNGFSTEYQNLFASLEDLKRDPSSAVARNQFLNYASSICSYFNTLSTNIANIQKQANDEIKTTVDKINTIAKQVASLNKQINTIEIAGGPANDLRDARALLIDELSKYINCSTNETALGNGATEFQVYINNQELVDGYDFNLLSATAREPGQRRNASDIDGLYDVGWANGLPFSMYSSSLGGSLRACIDMVNGCNEAYEIVGLRDQDGNFLTDNDGKLINVQDLTDDEYLAYQGQGYEKCLTTYESISFNSSYKGIPYYQSLINNFCQTFADVFNGIISKGDLDGEPVPDFMTAAYGGDYISALNICVNPKILADNSLLPYSYDNSVGAANNDMASDLVMIEQQLTINNGTFSDYLSTLVSVSYIDAGSARSFSTTYENIKNTIDLQRLSVSGVDEDEEAVDLVKFQHAYSLSSKVISVMQEIYNKLINETGV